MPARPRHNKTTGTPIQYGPLPKTVNFRDAKKRDLGTIVGLLELSGLPTGDCREQIDGFVLVEEHGRIVATGGLELHGKDALMRSIAIVPNRRNTGIGKTLCTELERRAAALGVENLFLLTEHAGAFFTGLGYQAINREDAPPSIQSTRQFSGLCPCSARLMFRKIKRATRK